MLFLNGANPRVPTVRHDALSRSIHLYTQSHTYSPPTFVMLEDRIQLLHPLTLMNHGCIVAMTIDLVRHLELIVDISKTDVTSTAVSLHEIIVLVVLKHHDDHIRPQTTAHGVIIMTGIWLGIDVLLKHLYDHILYQTIAHNVVMMRETWLELVTTLLPLYHHLPHHLDEDVHALRHTERQDVVSANEDGSNREESAANQYYEIIVTMSPTVMVEHPSHRTRLSHWHLQSRPQAQ